MLEPARYSSGKGTVTSIKDSGNSRQKSREEICDSYEELIHELVSERSQAITIANSYQSVT